MRVNATQVWMVVVVLAVFSAGAGAQAPESATVRAPEALSVVWRERLEGLRTSEPEAYLLLGEEVAAAAAQPADLRLARELFVLAYELDRKDGGRHGVMGPACLALADITPVRQDRRWLQALARAADSRYALPAWKHAGAAGPSPGAALAAATALGQVRSGDGGAARRQLANPEVVDALQTYDAALTPGGKGLRRVREWSEQWPCTECRNARVVKIAGSNPARYRVCLHCEGNPGPRLSRKELTDLLRVESWLLEGEQKTWAAQVAADEGAPLRDPEPGELAPTMGVDPARCVWREGGWTTPGEAARPGDAPDTE